MSKINNFNAFYYVQQALEQLQADIITSYDFIEICKSVNSKVLKSEEDKM